MEGRLEPRVLSADLMILPELAQEVQPLLGFLPDGVNVGGPLLVLGYCGSKAPMVLLRMVRGNWGALPEVKCHRHSFELV